MASVMNITPPLSVMGIPPRYSLTGGEGETPAKARWPGQSSSTGGPHHRHGFKGGFLTPGWDEAGPVPTQG